MEIFKGTQMEETGLYIHIPFCERKCHYCAFSSIPGANIDQIDEYFTALIKEIETWKGIDCKVKTVYFGGGTPSYVPAKKIRRVMKKLEEVFNFDALDPDIEKTIEVNPGSANEEKLREYHQTGFNRLSVGLQAAQNHLLEITGRIHHRSDFSNTIQFAEKAGFRNISADLMIGLPGQRIEDLYDSIVFLSSFQSIQHISCYSLSIEEGTVFSEWLQSGTIKLPDENTEREMYHHTCDQLKSFGFDQYEISNFAKQSYISRHNHAYWDLTPYIGMGAAAASYYHNKRWQNVSDPFLYTQKINHQKSVREEEHELSERERCGDFMFLGLRKTEGVCNSDYWRLFGSSFFEDYREEITQLISQGLLLQAGERIFLSSLGTDLANQVFMAFV